MRMVIKASLEANLRLYTILGCELDLRKQLIHNIRAHSKVKLSLQEVGMGVRNAATHYMAGLTTSLLQWAGALQMRTTMTMIMRIWRLNLGKHITML